VLIEDGGIVVLGGLIQNESTKGEDRVPFLGNIPLIGLLFKTRTGGSTKNNLMIFIRPKILRDPLQAAFQTGTKYNYMRDQEIQYNQPEILPMIPNVKKPLLAPAPPPPAYDPKERAIASPDEKARAAREQEEYDAAAVKKLQRSTKPGTGKPPVAPLPQPPAGSVATPPDGATTHPDGEPPYATEPPGVLMPPTTPPPPSTPPEGGK
jgi:general secretion pathway protein D